jgi:hypothetical protein
MPIPFVAFISAQRTTAGKSVTHIRSRWAACSIGPVGMVA